MTECQTCGKPAGDEKGIEQGCSLCKGSNLVIIRAMHWKGFCGGKFRNHGKEKQLEGRRSAETRVRVQDCGDCAMALCPERRRSTRVTMSKLKLGKTRVCFKSKVKWGGKGPLMKRHITGFEEREETMSFIAFHEFQHPEIDSLRLLWLQVDTG